jgi:hypothetical protein
MGIARPPARLAEVRLTPIAKGSNVPTITSTVRGRGCRGTIRVVAAAEKEGGTAGVAEGEEDVTVTVAAPTMATMVSVPRKAQVAV